MRPNPGDIIGGKYRILRMIGDGGMGAVYEARHEVLGTLTALKFLHAELARRPGLAARFLQEARVSASIQSPHVTKVTDVDQTPDGGPYLVMELLSGDSLQQTIDRQRRLPKDQAIDFALQILSGLEAAHALGVVHRDLKPDNVFITPSPGGPVLKLLDFGIAKLRQSDEYGRGLTRPGALMGTPEYMPPEQLYSADRVDHRADLYSLGVILFEMLGGERPAQGEDAAVIVGNVMAGKIKRLDEVDPSIDKNLIAVVHKSIESDKNRRYQSAMEFRSALAPFAGQLSHAGRLAATPVPAGVSHTPSPEKDGQTIKDTKRGPFAPSDPAAAPAAAVLGGKAGVPATLPPEDAPTNKAHPPTVGAAPAATGSPPTVGVTPMGNPPTVGASGSGTVGGETPGGTQEASKDLVAQLAAAQAAAHAVPGPRVAPAATPYATATPSPVHSPSGLAYGPPPMRKPQRSSAGPIIALVAGVLVTAGIVGVVVLVKQSKDDNGAQPIALGTSAPNTTIAPQGGGQNPVTPPTPPGPVPGPSPDPGPKPGAGGGGGGVKPPKKDAGADGGGEADAGQQFPGPFPFPVPPLPSGFPIPTFPIPGFPAPASSK